ncbi:MAG: CRISPR-associated helicase Cas3' [Bacillota bacterium]|nr:CRISPR-associated helicase Cas3' [Bacillota bacterium]
MRYLAHIDGEREQIVLEHLMGTAELARQYGNEFGAGAAAYRCALLHDIGKYSDAFQRRIRYGAEKPDHSTAGAIEAFQLKDVPAAFCIAGHHGGLPDLGNRKADSPQSPTLFGRLKRKSGKDIERYEAFAVELPELPSVEIPTAFLQDNLSCYFFTKMLYSSLVDADFIDTESFMSAGSVARGEYDDLSVYHKKLHAYIEPWWDPQTELNRMRTAILKALIAGGRAEKGLFSLTVPTGGGKTVASMSFALEHARENEMRRIIYVIPYTSIIEQTQNTFESVFGGGSILAHHSAADFGNDSENEIRSKRYLASENWDAPVILTTAVQFFESLYAAKSSKCRKLHNIANSIIIFDEAQMLPMPHLTACVAAMAQLVKNYGCSAVLCTATQPALNPLLKKLLPEQSVRELCPSVYSTNEVFKRVSFRKEGVLTDEKLARYLNAENQVLCVVNSRKQAHKLFTMLEEKGSFHLSTMMYPQHRRAVLEEIRDRLEAGETCRVVSTSLIEAGVDIDFPTVYRAIAGLDSVVQSAGRCNREGKNAAQDSIVHIFDTEQKAPDSLMQNIAAARRTLDGHDDISSEHVMQEYFNFLLYTLKDKKALDKKGIFESVNKGEMAFRTIGERFRIIEGCDCTVYVPMGAGLELTAQLTDGYLTRALMRKLEQYSVGVYQNHFRQLLAVGAIRPISGNTGVLTDTSLYSLKTGLSFGTDEGKGIFV